MTTGPRHRHAVIWTSVFVVLLLGVPAAVFANSISETILSDKPDWLYIVASGLVIIALIEGVYVFFLTRWLHEAESEGTRKGCLLAPEAALSSFAEVLESARREVFFAGVTSKRSFSDDKLRLILATGATPRIRVLLVDPDSESFRLRAAEEKESVEAWRHDHHAAVTRMRELKQRFNLELSLRLTCQYPVWRAMVVDEESVWVNVFLPRMRGTEARQWHIRHGNELAFAIIRSVNLMWVSAKEVEL